MTAPRHLQAIGITDVGCVRSGNEDCFVLVEVGSQEGALNPPELLDHQGGGDIFAAVSDGMGGAAAGELASQTALTSLSAYLHENAAKLDGAEPRDVVTILEQGVHEANRAIYQKAQEVSGSRGMGATITACYLSRDVLYLFQVGDSRAYVVRDGQLYQITRDQSFVGHLVEMGTITEEQAMRHPQRNVILQALGTQDHLKVDVSYIPLCKGDQVFICSDGLSGEFLPVQLGRLTVQATKQDLRSCVHLLVDEAKKAGGRDNITLVSLRVEDGLPESEPGETPRYMAFAKLDKDNPTSQEQSLFK